ncbi:hypothetical protein [Halomonas sp. M20]|uniref:hypothetical protein n=1 Tax=Halomonas sp. M20 TaxID=2763264 RepID=UPI001D0BAED1|nr:hypothetical protein [Halomonas sp. M20]
MIDNTCGIGTISCDNQYSRSSWVERLADPVLAFLTYAFMISVLELYIPTRTVDTWVEKNGQLTMYHD